MIRSTYTLREVAGIVAGCDDTDTITRLSRQIRHWTAEEIVPTIGKKHSGTGVHRRYDTNGVRRTAITAELVRYGITISGLDPFGEYLDGIQGSPDWDKAIKGTEIVYLGHSISDERFGVNVTSIGTIEDRNPFALMQARKNEDYGIGALDVESFASTLVINLTKLFARLRLEE